MNQTTPQFIYQPVPRSGANGLPKLKLTWVFRRFSGFARVIRFFWCSSKANQRYGKDAIPDDQSHGSSKSSNIGNGVQLTIILSCLGYTVRSMADQMSVNLQFKKIHTHPPIRHHDSTSIVKFANVVTNLVNTLDTHQTQKPKQG